MTKFGIIKSKIERLLMESYTNNTFKKEFNSFKTLVLENKNISKLFYLYDELNSNKGLNESLVNDYILECTKIYENTINKIKKSDLDNLNLWVKGTKTENLYENIDNLFNLDVLNIESRIQSKKIVSESLKKKPVQKKEPLNLPISTMISVANKTINNYIETLNESEKKELIKFLNTDDKQLQPEFESVKELVLKKLETLKESSDSDVLTRINETIEKVKSEKYDKLNYFKLKNLKENL